MNLLAKGLEHPFSTGERLTGSEFSLDKIVEFSGKTILLPEWLLSRKGQEGLCQPHDLLLFLFYFLSETDSYTRPWCLSAEPLLR